MPVLITVAESGSSQWPPHSTLAMSRDPPLLPISGDGKRPKSVIVALVSRRQHELAVSPKYLRPAGDPAQRVEDGHVLKPAGASTTPRISAWPIQGVQRSVSRSGDQDVEKLSSAAKQ
jgi:hypothetical protein